MPSRNSIAVFLLLGIALALLGSCDGEGEHPRLLESVVPPDTTKPVLIFLTPSDGDTFVSVRQPIQARFDEDLNPASVTPQSFVISPQVNAVRSACRTSVACTVWNELAYSTVYTVTLTSAITDLAGNAIETDTTWSFTTRDPPPPPVITGVEPSQAPVGAPVTIKGTGFDSLWWENIVWFTGDSAVVLHSTDSTLRTIVPEDATSGPITVENQVAIDTSDFDFVIPFPPASIVGTFKGLFRYIEKFASDSADTMSQHVVINWFPSGIYVMKLDGDWHTEDERVFCDIGGSFELVDHGVWLDVDISNFSESVCDTTLGTAGTYGSYVLGDSLVMIQYLPELSILKEFLIVQQ